MTTRIPYPSHRTAWVILLIIAIAVAASLVALLSVEDNVRLKQLIEDDGPVQGLGLISVSICLVLSLLYTLTDSQRRSSYLLLSYLLLFYTLREADYHYKLSEYAKATQFKRFFLHEQIPLSSKLFLATIVILFLVALYRYLTRERQGFELAVRQRLPWALYSVGWAACFILSQLIDQIPVFHNLPGQVAEEVLEATAQVLALVAMLMFRYQVYREKQAGIALEAGT